MTQNTIEFLSVMRKLNERGIECLEFYLKGYDAALNDNKHSDKSDKDGTQKVEMIPTHSTKR